MNLDGKAFQADPIASLQLIDAITARASFVTIDGVNCVYLNDPALIGEVLDTHWPEFRKEFGYKKSRDLIQPDLFSPTTVWPSAQEFVTISAELQGIVSNFVEDAGDRITDLYGWCRKLTMEIFLKTLLKGSVAPSVSQEVLEDATMRIIELLGSVILRFPNNIDSLDELDVTSHSALRGYAELFQQHPTCEHATPGRAMTTILAGYEQMASIMYWLIVHYAAHPLPSLKGVGAKQFLNEVIRLHSPIWTIMRRPKDDVRIGEYLLPRDSVVITSPWLMARNPTHFPEPQAFRPERWNEYIPTFAFFPFSHGPRVCKGERFVRTAMYALLSELASLRGLSCEVTGAPEHLINVSATPSRQVAVAFS